MVLSYQDTLIAGMVKRGYTIGPASADLNLHNGTDNQPAFMIAFTAFKAGQDLLAKDIYKDIVEILGEINAYYYGIVVAQAYDSTWVGCNFNMSDKKRATPPPLPTPDKSRMN